jgi:hypothetical protein
MNVKVKGRLAIMDQAAANALVPTARRTNGLYRVLISGDKLLLCQGNDVLAASPLAQPHFRFDLIDENGRSLTPPQ